ncbi:MAG TPA: SRPBCC family protein [Phototrophicaceae bacterium]|nr:SRPBCC family protein [Phototrophicaceae bacterium]
MTPIHAEATTIIKARPEAVYAVIADYRVGHPAILPKPYFTELAVEQGGQGAGTIIRVGMNVMGVKQVYHEVVSEPQPGRVLVEADAEAGVTSTFTVEPVNAGQQARVTIASDARPSPGLKGLLERLFNPPITRRIFQQELRQLAAYVERQPSA